jgi:hypothetical protein
VGKGTYTMRMRISFSLRLIFLMMLSSPMVLEATGEIERERDAVAVTSPAVVAWISSF